MFVTWITSSKVLGKICTFLKMLFLIFWAHWTLEKYLNILHYSWTQKPFWHFFLNILQKYYQIPILGTLDMSGHSLYKRWTLSLTFFLRHCKGIANLLLWELVLEYFENDWSWPSILIASPCRKLWRPKCWKQLAGNFYFNLHTKNQLHF